MRQHAKSLFLLVISAGKVGIYSAVVNQTLMLPFCGVCLWFSGRLFFRMFILYADESGTPSGSDQEHFILAGISVFERKTHWLSMKLGRIAKRFNESDPDSVELHGSPMMAGRGFWRKFQKEQRLEAIKDALRHIDGKHYRIFASVVNKAAISPEDPVKSTFNN